MAEGSFIRVYHEDLIANFPEVWEDHRALGLWVHLFADADRLWPTPPKLPVGLPRTALRKLVDAELVVLLPMSRYKVRGLDALRLRQQASARHAAEARWDAPGNADRNASGNAGSNADRNAGATHAGARPRSGPPSGDSSAETDGAERPHNERSAFDDPPEQPALAYLASVKAAVAPTGNGYHRELVLLVERQGVEAVVAAMRRRHEAGDKSARQLIYGAANELEPIARAQGAKPKAGKFMGPSMEEVDAAFSR